MACVRMDMSDPTARSLCFSCGASWTIEIENPCPDCGAALVSRERVIREFEGSVRDREASLPEFSSLELLCTTTGEDEQRHVRERLEEYQVAYFSFSEEPRRARDGSSALPITTFYIADLQVEWARDRLADIFHGGGSVLIARAADEVEVTTYRAALEDRDIKSTTSRLQQYPVVGIGPLAETLLFVAEVDADAARQAIEDVRSGEASTIGAQEVEAEALPGTLPADIGSDPQESSPSSTAGSGVPDDESLSLQDLRDERRDNLTRLLLFLSAAINLLLGAMYFGSSDPRLGVFPLVFGAVLGTLGRLSRRDPEFAFGWSLLLLILYDLGALVTMNPWAFIGGFFALLTLLATLSSWRRARERRLEKS